MKKLNIDQVAKLAHVSRSVVSRVLNNHPNVSDVARQRVMEVVEKYNYKPNSVARKLATNRSREIGVLVTKSEDDALGNMFWTHIHLGVFEECADRGYFASLSYVSSSKKDDLYDHILNERRLDGYILLTQEVTDLVGDVLFQEDIPIVLVGHVPKKEKVSSVDVDNFLGGKMATEHLIKKGHENIGMIVASLDVKESVDRLNGYKQALADAGLEYNEDLISVVNYQFDDGFKSMDSWIKEERDLTAVFCASDTLAMGALLAVNKYGKKVPDDYAFVGFDNLNFSKFTTPPLTTIDQPVYQKGRTAAKLLLDQVEEVEAGHHEINLPPKLVIRESCGK